MDLETKAQSDAATGPLTLAIDIGGTGLKGAVLNASGELFTDRVRVPTPENSTNLPPSLGTSIVCRSASPASSAAAWR
jgi:predicted NBD/HSP70 family sugar kinase